jgi:hypothetical protein
VPRGWAAVRTTGAVRPRLLTRTSGSEAAPARRPERGASYVERYRGTDWDSGILDAKPSDPLSVNILSAVLMGSIAFAVLIAFWLLLSFTS